MKEIDARGLACPAPVLQTKAALQEESPNGVRVVVDNAASQQNVQRFLESQEFQTTLEQVGADYVVIGNCDSMPSVQPQPASGSARRRQKDHGHVRHRPDLVLVTTLGLKLMANFLRTLKEMGDELWRLVFVNNGVKLTIEGSEVLEDLKAYESAGLKILVCGTCLDHFSLLEKKRVGETTNMLDIVTAMQLADKVINI
jgi:selenium metabolism protein YedF